MPMTPEEKTALVKELEEKLTASLGEAIGTQILGSDAFKKTITESVEGLGLAGQITTAIDGLKAELLKEPPKKKKTKEGEGGGGDDEALKAMQAEVDQLKKDRLDAEQARDNAEKKRRESKRDNAIRTLLSAKGVQRPELAMAALKHSGLIGWANEEDEKAGILGKGAYGRQEMLPAEDGLKGWLSTEDGKTFLPSIEGGGNGEKRRHNNSQNSGDPVSADDALRSAFGNL